MSGASALATCSRLCGGGRRQFLSGTLLALAWLLFLDLPSVDAATGKRKKRASEQMLAAIPATIKFFLFWWCVLVFIVMSVYILDMLYTKVFGPAKVEWCLDRYFNAEVGHTRLWAQFVDPSAWLPSHPLCQSADLSMVEVVHVPSPLLKKPAAEEPDPFYDADVTETRIKVSGMSVNSVPLAPLKVGLGLELRHKSGTSERAGRFFCTRECTELQLPGDKQTSAADKDDLADSPSHKLSMRTVEVGVGHVYLTGSEEMSLELWPVSGGQIFCRMRGVGEVRSRLQRWWSAYGKQSVLATEPFLDAIEQEALRVKPPLQKS